MQPRRDAKMPETENELYFHMHKTRTAAALQRRALAGSSA